MILNKCSLLGGVQKDLMEGLENDSKEMFIIRRRVEGSDSRVGKCY